MSIEIEYYSFGDYNPTHKPFIFTADKDMMCEIVIERNELKSYRWK